MLKLDIEWKITGPLAHRATLYALQEAVEKASCLAEAADKIRLIPRLCVYRSGDHLAVHEVVGNQMGTQRLALITNGG